MVLAEETRFLQRALPTEEESRVEQAVEDAGQQSELSRVS